jgi:hypothetical protein
LLSSVPPGFDHQHDGCQAQGKGVGAVASQPLLLMLRHPYAGQALGLGDLVNG